VHYKRWNKRLDEFLTPEKITKIDSNCVTQPSEQVSSSCCTS
jgi:RNA binding activity-knot of a chromodomain